MQTVQKPVAPRFPPYRGPTPRLVFLALPGSVSLSNLSAALVPFQPGWSAHHP